MTGAGGGRRYAGLDADARRAARRAALLDAGLELFGTRGYARVSVKQVCDEARLTQRYFYESFADREALLAAVYGGIVAQIQERLLTAVSGSGRSLDAVVEGALEALGDVLLADRRAARVVVLEVVGVSPELEAARYDVVHAFGDLVVSVAADALGAPVERRHRIAAVALVGGLTQLLVDWARDETCVTADDVRTVGADLLTAAFRHFFPDATAAPGS